MNGELKDTTFCEKSNFYIDHDCVSHGCSWMSIKKYTFYRQHCDCQQRECPGNLRPSHTAGRCRVPGPKKSCQIVTRVEFYDRMMCTKCECNE